MAHAHLAPNPETRSAEGPNQDPVGDEPGHDQGWQEGDPDDNDVGDVKMVVILVGLGYHLSYDSVNGNGLMFMPVSRR